MPLVVTPIDAFVCCPWESVKVAVQAPAATPVAVNVALGPDALLVVIVAIVPDPGLQVSDSPKLPV